MKISAGLPVWRAAAGAGGGAVRVGGEVAEGGGGLEPGPGGGQLLHNIYTVSAVSIQYLHSIYTISKLGQLPHEEDVPPPPRPQCGQPRGPCHPAQRAHVCKYLEFFRYYLQ